MVVKHRLLNMGLTCLCLLWLAACNSKKKPDTIDENYTLSPTNDEPFGASAAYQISQTVFPQHTWIDNNRSFDQWEKGWRKSDWPQVYLLATPTLHAFEQEADAMQRFVSHGNTMLIATDDINETVEDFFAFRIKIDPMRLPDSTTGPMQDTWLQLQDSNRLSQQQFGYFYYPFHRYLSASSKYQSVQVLAHNAYKQPTVMRIRLGMGQVIVATNARCFSNYFLLNRENANFLLGLFAYFPANPTAIIWDNFYHSHQHRPPPEKPLFEALLANPALRWAMAIAMGLALLWVMGNLRRKQQQIPILQPNTNTTVSFVQTIAQLYLSKADHANIARKMTAHFVDYLRSNYYLPPQIAGADWPALLHHKTGIPIASGQKIHRLMERAQNEDPAFSAADLLQLHLLLGEAYSQKKAPAVRKRLQLFSKR